MNRHKKFDYVGTDLTDAVFSGEITFTKKRKIKELVVHCAATDYKKYYDAFDIDDWHEQRWGSGCGYHYVILLDGTIQEGRDINYVGAHVRGHNRGTIGISYIGGVDSDDNPVFDNLTDNQYQSLMQLLDRLIIGYNLHPQDVFGHNEYPGVAKDCPCLTMDNIRYNLGPL